MIENRQLAERIATALFTSGAGNVAERLMKTGGGAWGGWGFGPAVRQIEKALQPAPSEPITLEWLLEIGWKKDIYSSLKFPLPPSSGYLRGCLTIDRSSKYDTWNVLYATLLLCQVTTRADLLRLVAALRGEA